MKLSIVASLFQSARYISDFHRRASEVAKQIAGSSYEIVLVNDGSIDASLETAVTLARGDPHVVVVDLSRNFGHHKAMMTGLAFAKGEKVFLIDSDLEEEPEWLLSFMSKMSSEKVDVVFGVQSKRRGGIFERVSGWFFYKLFRVLTGLSQPDNILTARLMSRRYVNALLQHKERELNIGALWIITGFKQAQLALTKKSTSPTTYSFARKLEHFINAITSFSSTLLVVTFYVGLIIFLAALAYAFYIAWLYFFVSTPPDGYTSTITSIWLLSGLVILFLGIQGIYISKIFYEVKQRPYTIVRDVYKSPHDQRTYDES